MILACVKYGGDAVVATVNAQCVAMIKEHLMKKKPRKQPTGLRVVTLERRIAALMREMAQLRNRVATLERWENERVW